MGVEFRLPLLAAQSVSDAGNFARVSACFEQSIAGQLHLVAASSTYRRYAFEVPFRSKWPEDLVIQFDSSGWYLCFHAATSHQQKVILQALSQCLAAVGVTEGFEEL